MLKIYKTEETGKLVKLKKFRSVTKSWLNLINPSGKEIEQVSQMLKLDADILLNPLDADERSRVELDGEVFSVIVNLPLLDEEGTFDTLPCGLVFQKSNFLPFAPVITALSALLTRLKLLIHAPARVLCSLFFIKFRNITCAT